MAEIEQHLTIEQLSTMLDGQLSPSEQEHAQKHLLTCEQCQQQQAELRQTVALLHALPQPALPRSFVLPLDTTFAEPATIPATTPHSLRATRTRSTQRPFGPSYLSTTIRVVSALAAVAGIFFLLSSVLPMLVFHAAIAGTGASGVSNSNAAMPKTSDTPRDITVTQETMSPNALTEIALSTPPEASAVASKATSVQIQATSAQSYQPLPPNIRSIDTPDSSIATLFNLSTLQGRTILGFLLLVLGISGLVVFKSQRPIA